LSARPSHIEARKQVGHWECDTVIGANHKGAFVTMVERKSGFGVIVKVAHKTSELVSKAIMEGLQPFADRVKTLTYDNGKEFASHIQIDQTLVDSRTKCNTGLIDTSDIFQKAQPHRRSNAAWVMP